MFKILGIQDIGNSGYWHSGYCMFREMVQFGKSGNREIGIREMVQFGKSAFGKLASGKGTFGKMAFGKLSDIEQIAGLNPKIWRLLEFRNSLAIGEQNDDYIERTNLLEYQSFGMI
ncbi:hypothetical protein RclHR1_00260014 [Rhizophagus clarus]|uniref:Uncharacterized protein n=1 Tax=Rhizophagus clarus TaxID=94130 RepID=A0A2Z6RDQ1_9GLOM|nr:hypothetical protein RclHR1_00260014 [Rhizophagus clarus]